jgi:lactate dehydrogenase-like 2-hydroxyacid dehydrogenase
VAIYRVNESAEHVGVFDKALIDVLPPTLRWIAHNGAGYDAIDVKACKEKGKLRHGSSYVKRAPDPDAPVRMADILRFPSRL